MLTLMEFSKEEILYFEKHGIPARGGAVGEKEMHKIDSHGFASKHITDGGNMREPELGDFIIWGPGGPSNPKAYYAEREKAEKTALVMAKQFPDREFYVCKLLTRSLKREVETERIDDI